MRTNTGNSWPLRLGRLDCVLDQAIAWRNEHALNKEIWITEFGYDACTDAAMEKRTGWFEKLDWSGVTEFQQAQYLVRSLLCFAEHDVDSSL